MKIIECNCNEESCNSIAIITQDDYLIIREYHNNEHYIASIKLPADLAAYIRIHLRYPNKSI